MSDDAVIVWKHQFPEARVSSGAFATLLCDRVLWQAFGYGLHAISTDGKPAWQRPAKDSTPFFAWNDRVYIGGARAECLDPRTGGVIAVHESGRQVRVMSPTAACARYWERTDNSKRETMLALGLEDLSPLWAVPPPSGAVKWIGDWYFEFDQATSEVTVRRPPSPEPRGRFQVDPDLWYFHPFLSDGVLIFRAVDYVQAIDAFDGRTLWRRARSEGFGHDRVVDGTFYLFSQTLSAIDAATGRELWSLETEEPANDLTVLPDRLLVSTRDGRLRAVDRQTGRVITPPIDTRLEDSVLKMWPLSAQDLILLTFEASTNSEALWRIAVR